jgi:hypothetical protein
MKKNAFGPRLGNVSVIEPIQKARLCARERVRVAKEKFGHLGYADLAEATSSDQVLEVLTKMYQDYHCSVRTEDFAVAVKLRNFIHRHFI